MGAFTIVELVSDAWVSELVFSQANKEIINRLACLRFGCGASCDSLLRPYVRIQEVPCFSLIGPPCTLI